MVRKKLLTPRALVAVTILSVLAGAIACRPRDPLKIKTIQTGRTLNSDNSVGTHTMRFKPDDTMFVAVLTEGRGAGTFVARWMYAGRLVNEETRKVSSYADHAATEFHIKNSSGFPAGDYTVEILQDGKSIGIRNLRVDK